MGNGKKPHGKRKGREAASGNLPHEYVFPSEPGRNAHLQIAEYEQLMALIRHYGNVRFATLTLAVAICGGLLAILFGEHVCLPKRIITALPLVGALATGVCWIIEVSAALAWRHCAQRAAKLEGGQIGFRIHSTMPGAPTFNLLPTTYMVSVLYLTTIGFWIWVFALLRG